MKFRGAVAL